MHPLGHEVHPQPEQESIFRTVFAGWVRFGGVFIRSSRATTKKRSSTFLVRKSAPSPHKILATPMSVKSLNSRLRNSASRNKKHRYIIWCETYFDVLSSL